MCSNFGNNCLPIELPEEFINIINNFNTSNLTLINSGSYKKDIYCSKDQIYSEMGIWTYYSKRIEKKQILEICKIEN